MTLEEMHEQRHDYAKQVLDFAGEALAANGLELETVAIVDLDPLGKRVFEGACASCHSWIGQSALTPYATLTGARAVNDPNGINAAQIVTSGMTLKTRHGMATMPAFRAACSDVEIAAVVNYVTGRFDGQGSNIKAQDIALLRGATSQ